MTARFSHSGFSHLGFSLMEMLVGISLGLVVLTMALSAWHTSQQAWQALVAQQNLQHNIRAALQALTTQAELSGAAVLMGVPNRTAVVAVRHDLGQPAVWASDNAKGGDSLQLSHSRHLDSGDCQGNRNNMGDTIRSQFQRSSSTVNDFACKDVLAAGSTYQAIAEGVEDVQVRLAERSVDGQRLQWNPPSDVRDAAQVVAMDICLLVVSPTFHAAARTTSVGCQGEPIAADGHMRQLVRQIMRVQSREAFSVVTHE